MTDAEVFSAVEILARNARAAAHRLSQLSTGTKNAILLAMAAELRARTSEILAANALDLAAGEAKGLSKPMLERLKLDEKKVDAMAGGIEQVAALPDPVGEVMEEWSRPNGMRLQQVRVPIGTIGIIFESRPNVTSDAAVLCFKTGNATILRGGSEAIHSNRAIAAALQGGGERVGLPANAIQLVPFTDRSSVSALCQMDKWLDLIIPRGGKGLIETVVSQARMPVIKHYDGICHLFVDEAADLPMSVKLTVDSKTQKTGVCNALETLLVHATVAESHLPAIAAALREKGVELRGCERTRAIIDAVPATEEDWVTEYLNLILSVKIVDSLEEAVEHINAHGSHHTECIVSDDEAAADAFLAGCDSACVFHNVSTRLADGEEFGFGAEIGISTDKLHARGPMGLRELTSYQYRVRGSGQTKGS
ncbi:MAG: glutamate-5-semialdehyde dehydrogenase [Verrucomicrobia bacterium]|nr:MAG: glutamate-5-semialdehyde dehydrogenase [Verrucomicrobiota bacterium]TAE86458.1 MAG: glutamate-5-semialdehyde dehydrogenase [Verrucomicrobiota bacterium]TAF23986.1 MAG: glutamate-5-semialdehyde dehydrogenase [Verrucomicrobiota bacterium]